MNRTREKEAAKVGFLIFSFVFLFLFLFVSPKNKRGVYNPGRGPDQVLADTVGSTAEVRGTSSSSVPTGFPFQRKTWYDGSNYWMSYHDQGDGRVEFWYKDGDLWNENTSARVTVDTNDFTVEADSTNLFVAYTNGYDVETRAASSYPGTDFSWGSPTLAYDGAADDEYSYPAMKEDTGGKVWLSSRHVVGVPKQSGNVSGPEFPGTVTEVADGNDSWSSTDVYDDDGSDATCLVTGNKSSHTLEITNFGFSYSYTCSAIDGIEVEVEKRGEQTSDDYIYDNLIQLINGSGTRTGDDKGQSSAWPTSNTVVTYGGSSDNWNASLSCTDVTNSNFGMALQVFNYKGGGPSDLNAYVDYVKITVYYTNQSSIGYVVEAVQSVNATDISSWSTPSTIEGESATAEKYATLAPLASGDMYAAIATDSTLVGCKYDAQTDNRWEDSSGNTCQDGDNQDIIDDKKTGMEYGMSMVDDDTNNYAHLAYINDAGSLMYRKYTSSWSSASTIDSNTDCAYPSLSILTEESDELYSFWTQAGDLYAVKSTSPYTDWSGTNTTIDGTGSNWWVSSGYEGFGSCSMFTEWSRGSDSSTLIDWDSLTPDVCVDTGDPPTIGTVQLNGGSNIVLNSNTTKAVSLSGPVTDNDGCGDIGDFSAAIYLNALDLSCSADDNSCYTGGDVTCSTSTCNGGTADVTCSSDLWFHANPEQWVGSIMVTDGSSNTVEGTSSAVTVNELMSILSAESDIHYGSVPEGSATPTNQTVSVTTVGNVAVDCSLWGTDMTSQNTGESIEVTNQKYSLGNSSYSNLDNTLLSGGAALELLSSKPTTNPSNQIEVIYWGLRVPSGKAGADDYGGTNTLEVISD